MELDFDTRVKLDIYETIARTAHVADAFEVAGALNAPVDEVLAAFARLHQKRLLVPEPGDASRIRMAPPFAGIETPFRVQVAEKVYFANCAWDALGVAAALHQDARIEASDAASGEPIHIEVINEQPLPQACVVHFAVPAAHWWKDIIYT